MNIKDTVRMLTIVASNPSFNCFTFLSNQANYLGFSILSVNFMNGDAVFK